MYANTLIELLHSFGHSPNSSTLRELVYHIYKHRVESLKNYAQSFLTAFPEEDFPKEDLILASDSEELLWLLERVKLSRSLASIIKGLQEEGVLPERSLNAPSLLYLWGKNVTGPIRLIYRFVRWMSGRPISGMTPEDHAHKCSVLLKDIIDGLPLRYWCLEELGENLLGL